MAMLGMITKTCMLITTTVTIKDDESFKDYFELSFFYKKKKTFFSIKCRPSEVELGAYFVQINTLLTILSKKLIFK